MSRIIIKPQHFYSLRGVLPRTNKVVVLCTITKKEDYELLCPTYLKFFKSVFLHERKLYGHSAKIVTKRENKDITVVSRVVLQRIKRQKRKKIEGNVLLKRDENYVYIQAKQFRQRVVLKFDLEDEEKIMKVLKKTYYFRARYFKTYKKIYFIHNKYKLRTNSVYRYLLGDRIYNMVEHIDGNPLNFSKSNLKILNVKVPAKPESERKPSFTGILNNKKVEDLIGIKRYCDRKYAQYVAATRIKGKDVKIGRFNDPYEAAMAYDIAQMYYKGPNHTKNYPSEYYINLRQDLVSKWFDNLANREINKKNNLAQALPYEYYGN